MRHPEAALAPDAGAVELLPGDGSPFNPFTLPEYQKEFATSTAVVVAKTFPPKVTPLAGAGVNLFARGKNVSWVIDGVPAHGFILVYDENANGDLRDDKRGDFTRTTDGWELALSLQFPAMFGDEPIEAPARIRFRNGALRIQDSMTRRGTVDEGHILGMNARGRIESISLMI